MLNSVLYVKVSVFFHIYITHYHLVSIYNCRGGWTSVWRSTSMLTACITATTHERHGVLNHWPLDILRKHVQANNKTSKICLTGAKHKATRKALHTMTSAWYIQYRWLNVAYGYSQNIAHVYTCVAVAVSTHIIHRYIQFDNMWTRCLRMPYTPNGLCKTKHSTQDVWMFCALLQ